MDSSQVPSIRHDTTISDISADDRRSPSISKNSKYLGTTSQNNFTRKKTALFGHSDPLLKESEHDANLSDYNDRNNTVLVPFTEERKLETLDSFEPLK